MLSEHRTDQALQSRYLGKYLVSVSYTGLEARNMLSSSAPQRVHFTASLKLYSGSLEI